MGYYRINKGIAVITDSDSGSFIVDETGRRKVTSPLVSALLGLMEKETGDERRLVEILIDRFPLVEIYYTIIQLEKQGIVVSDAVKWGSPADLFRAKVSSPEGLGYPQVGSSSLTVRVFAIGGVNESDVVLFSALGCSDVIKVKRINDWSEIDPQAIYVVVTSDYLEPELKIFGHFAHERCLRWLPVKPNGVVPWVGPLFIPGETGCVECFLDRVRGHRRLELQRMGEKGGSQSLRLSVGQTVHSFETVAGLLAVELEKLATGGKTVLAGGLVALDFRNFDIARHPLRKRPQCPICGTIIRGTQGAEAMSNKPLLLNSQVKADYRDGGQRICLAVDTLEKYSDIISPITGIVGRLTPVKEIPDCFGAVVRSNWIVRGEGSVSLVSENGRLSVTGLSTGKGRSMLQARASALGEAIERYSSQHEGYEPHIRDSFTALGDVAIHPYDLMGFSEKQYRDREVWQSKGATAYVPEPYDSMRPIDWTPAWSLTHNKWKLVPSAFVYYSYPQEGGGDICRGCSNGVAAGNCLEEAIMQGFYELVERDATAMWWYHRLHKPAVDWRGFDSSFTAAVDATMKEIKMDVEVLDLTNDLGIPVFSVNLFDGAKKGRLRSIGLGCHFDPRIALERAVAELGQCWGLLEWSKGSLSFPGSTNGRDLYLRADPRQTPKRLSDFTKKEHTDFLNDIEEAILLLGDRELEMLVVDLTRPDIGFPVVRVIVPGMVHFWPRFGCRRLFDVPKSEGWIGDDVGEDDLNPIPFFL